jgi:hypothetical protein
MALLDWIEENAEPLSFTDTPSHVGFAVGRESQRLRLDRESLRVTTAGPVADVQPLSSALESVWSIVEPHDVVLSTYHGSWSYELKSDYESARRAFTARTVPGQFSAGISAYDCAALIEMRTPLGVYGVEFGLVTGEELSERLLRTDVGIARTSPDNRPPIEVAARDLPEVSGFVDVGGYYYRPVESAKQLVSEYRTVEREVSGLVNVIGRTL